ncbi:MAG: toxin HicA [Spirochaetes bacterium]|nr:toxin HicA [Spirochaetota bacterium]
MSNLKDIIIKMKRNPGDIRFGDLCKVCESYFGKPRSTGGSHHIYKTPWQGDPRINIQNNKGKAKIYQVKQILKAIELMEKNHGTEK